MDPDKLILRVSRRTVLGGLGAASMLAGCSTVDRLSVIPLGQAERNLGGRIGVFAIDLQTGRRLGHRENERFAMCSTFKWALGAQALSAIDGGGGNLDEQLRYSERELVPHSPVTKRFATRGFMTIRDLCAATIVFGDNAAANILLRRFGGPAAFTAFLQRTEDTVTRLDRMETELNENAPGDVRDTTTPAAMAGSMERLLFGATLTAESEGLLRSWMQSSTTGLGRLRAGMPKHWAIGDKTGSGANGASNDVAFAFPLQRARPILIASYINAPTASAQARDNAHREIAEQVVVSLM